MAELPPFAQTTGVAQGDNLSLVLFSVLVCDLPTAVLGKYPRCQVPVYADDVVICDPSRFHVQLALTRIATCTTPKELTMNTTKTENVKFRRERI